MPNEPRQRSQLARQLSIAIATPLFLLLVLGAILGRQILQMSEDSRWLDHSDHVLGIANDTVKQIIDQETGFRGYLLTGDRVFLEPYERAHPRDGLTRLHDLLADNPPQQARVDEARRRYEDWDSRIATVVQGRDLEPARASSVMRDRKVGMDGVREIMGQAIQEEETLRHDRLEAARASTEATKIAFVLLLGLAAAVLALLSRRQLSAIARTFGEALHAEEAARTLTEAEAWVREGQRKLGIALQGEHRLDELGNRSLALLTEYTGADVGAFFARHEGAWHRHGAYGMDSRTAAPATFATGEGIVGRVAEERKLLHLREVPPDFLKIRSGTGEATPAHVVVIPACVDDTANAVLELGFLRPPDASTLEMLARIGDDLAVAVRSSEYKARLRELLEDAQRQAEELQTQQEELRVANEELETQANALKKTQAQLETQQAELEQTNENVVQQAHLLERQNRRLAETQDEITVKAREVERASQYKSEFLSNMSHELRTPLNSTLILAKLLADNKEGNLSAEQVRSAETIHSAGNDLLALINDILDLSKVEAGRMDVKPAPIPLERVRTALGRLFEPVALERGLRFAVTLTPSTPETMETDVQRLEQILNNLVSNALKFTERGEVVVEVAAAEDRITFAVRDTGIGVPEEQQEIIFESFRQVDGTTHRKYGGTGLGLSISRDLARLLGGDITITSKAGEGSTFTLSLPRVYTGPLKPPALAAWASPRPLPPTTPALEVTSPDSGENEDEEKLDPGRRLVLVVEDDEAFARILSDVAREAGFQCLVARTAKRGFSLARKHAPMGILLDITLPDHTGLSVLDRLKRDPVTRHIPVHVISASDYTETALNMGAAAYSIKPLEREQLVHAVRALERKSSNRSRRVLVVEDDDALRESVAKLLGREDVDIVTAATVADALAKLREKSFDCVVTDLSLPDQTGFDLLETMAAHEPYSVPPVIVYTGRSLTADEEQRLRQHSRSIIVKGARSPERLLDEVTLFLHQVESELPAAQQRLLEHARHRESVFEGRTILLAEDDVRNVFALTSLLEPKGARVAIARNGKEALAALESARKIDLVLMDIMMPEMDGLEAIRLIRENPLWRKLPILAITSKAMKDDQERCLSAGANDYLAKPLDLEMLLSLLRVWMPKA